jgi:hypothetical protein
MKKYLLGLICCLSFASCATIYAIKSRVPESPIVIDAKTDDWRGALYVLEDEKAFVGVTNDQTYLYICLVAGEGGSSGEIMKNGLTVWLDPSGGTRRTLGIKYPMGVAGEPENKPPGGRRPGEAERKPGPGPVMPVNDGIEIVRGTSSIGELTTIEAANKMGLEVRVGASGGSFVYELKIPLVSTGAQSLAVGAAPGTKIGIGFQTGEPQLGRKPEDSDSLPGGIGGIPGARMGGPGGIGGGTGGGRAPDIPMPLKLWVVVQLR